MTATICRHCNEKQSNRPRGLCWVCYYMPGVKEQYPSASKFAPGREPTEEELEATIEIQRRNLPPWWDKAWAHDGYDREPGV